MFTPEPLKLCYTTAVLSLVQVLFVLLCRRCTAGVYCYHYHYYHYYYHYRYYHYYHCYYLKAIPFPDNYGHFSY